MLYVVKNYQPRNGTVFEKSTEAWSYYKRCNSSIRLGSESLRFDAEKKGGTGGAADGRPPVLNKEMNSIAVFGSNPEGGF